MKKRLFFLIVLAFLLCGCSANVNITIKDNTVTERISINEAPYDVFSMSDIKQQYRKYIPAFYNVPIIDTMPDEQEENVEYYKMTGTELSSSFNAFYQYNFKFKDYKNARSIRNAFRSSEVQFDTYEKQVLFTTESSGMILFKNIPQLTEVKVNITTDYPVLETNADYSNGNTYTWIFNKNTKKGIYLLLSDQTGKSIAESNAPANNDNSSDKKDDEEVKSDDEEKKGGSNTLAPDNKKEEQKSEAEKTYEEIQEKGSKHPGIVIAIAIGLFLFVVFFSLKVKKV